MREIISSYPVRKIIVEFQNREIFANGRKFRDIDELLDWIADCEKVHRHPFSNNIP